MIEAVEQFEPDLKNHENVFYAFSKAWMVKFKDKITILPNQEKHRYIPNILNSSNRHIIGKELRLEISNIELVSRATGMELEDGGYDISLGEYEEEYKEESPFESISGKDFNSMKKAARKILSKIKTSKLSNDRQAQDEAYNAYEIFKQYASDHGLYCRLDEENMQINLKPLLKLKPEQEKIRQRIKNQIANAIKDMEADIPMLATHLRKSIKTKLTTTIYSPENPTEWFISL